jgi:macrolide transport system ATP-binding/permease protein
VAGKNGSGKTTLLKMITGEEEPDSGRIIVRGRVCVIAQFDSPEDRQAHSGGEKTSALIARALKDNPDLLLADEPTTNLDMESIKQLEALFTAFDGALILVSHDRTLLQNVCTKVLEIENGTCKLYSCGYEDYLEQKELERSANMARYESFAEERSRLKKVAADKARQSSGVRKAPKRMGNSEARLHKMGGQKQKAKLDRAAKAARSRLEQLEKVEKPWQNKDISFDLHATAIHSPVLVSINCVSKSYGEKCVLEYCSFTVPNGQKTALTGPNGAGKTTLLEMIAACSAGVETCAHLRIGYFKQDLSTLDFNSSVLGNAMANAVYEQQFVRTILARLLFRRDQVHHMASTLSGGERLKLALAKIILSGFHLLVLDEPTNFLDIESRSALEAVLCAYPGAVLFVSHDRAFINAVADRIVYIKDRQTHTFEGGLKQFEQARCEDG